MLHVAHHSEGVTFRLVIDALASLEDRVLLANAQVIRGLITVQGIGQRVLRGNILAPRRLDLHASRHAVIHSATLHHHLIHLHVVAPKTSWIIPNSAHCHSVVHWPVIIVVKLRWNIPLAKLSTLSCVLFLGGVLLLHLHWIQHALVTCRTGRTESDWMLLMQLLLLLFMIMGRRCDDLTAALRGKGRRTGTMTLCEVVLTIGRSTDFIFVPLLRTLAARNDLIVGTEQERRRLLLASNLI
jgi:hypothetical protein